MDRIHFIEITEYPPIPDEWMTKNYTPAWMKNPADWWRENYQRDVAAKYIEEKYGNQQFLLNCSDVDELPRPKLFEMGNSKSN